MTEIFVLTCGDYGIEAIIGVFSSANKIDNAILEYKQKNPERKEKFVIYKGILDEIDKITPIEIREWK